MRVRRPLFRLTEKEILAGLNAALEAEEQAAADYQAHAQASDVDSLRGALEALCEVEREHALRLAQRINALGSSPVSSEPEALPVGDSPATWLAQDLAGEQWAIGEYARLVAGAVDDDETAELMAELLQDEIRHARWLKSTLRAFEGSHTSTE